MHEHGAWAGLGQCSYQAGVQSLHAAGHLADRVEHLLGSDFQPLLAGYAGEQSEHHLTRLLLQQGRNRQPAGQADQRVGLEALVERRIGPEVVLDHPTGVIDPGGVGIAMPHPRDTPARSRGA
jgi:hypothetical protein